MHRVAVLVSVAALGVAAGAAARPSVSSLLLGIAGDPARFQKQTGQRSAIRHAFLGWGQGQAWGKPIVPLLETLGPIPMIHLGIGNARRRPVITPADIAAGRGDAYLIALNEGIAEYGGKVYVRPLAEMNNCRALYAAVTCTGASRGPRFSPAAYRAAFRRMYAILHGEPGALARRGVAAPGARLAVNPPSRLRVIWNPLGGGQPASAANAATAFYPGDDAVDLVGNDIYDIRSAPQNEALYRFARERRKRYSFPEWGTAGGDDPSLIEYVCAFVRGHAAIELAAYYESKAGSPYDIEARPRSRAAYRRCITPLGAES